MIQLVKKTLTVGQILDVATMCEELVNKSGKNQTLSYLIAKNGTSFVKIAYEFRQKLYNQYSDEEFVKYDNARNELILMYCDKDQDGKPVLNEKKQYTFKTNLVEFDTEIKKLGEQYKETLERVQGKLKENDALIVSAQEVEIWVTDEYKDLPEDMEPYWYSIFVK